MRVKIEYGCRVRETEVEEIKIVETDNFYRLYCDLKRTYIKVHNIEGDPNCSAEDYLNEFSEIDEEEEMTFYIGFEEGEYIEGWKLI
tara:strand:+ start:361 stop:621 length:261 start_codon:yes stop_codon:yes gene_type:complete